MHYIVLKDKNESQLAKEVQRYLERGYEPQGGVSMAHSSGGFATGFVFAQALIKKTESE